MSLNIENQPINKFIMIGDKVLIKPKNPQSQTKSGLYLPPSVQENERIQSGYIVKTGPGFPLPNNEEEEPWKKMKRRSGICLFRPGRAIWLYSNKMRHTKSHSTKRFT